MSKQQLSLSGRPQSFAALVGQDRLIERIRGHFNAGRTIKSWLFIGPTGTGKTTTARILAGTLNCTHQKTWGAPCRECRVRPGGKGTRAGHSVHEINCAKLSGVRELEDALDGSDYAPFIGKYRIYILDEVQKSSDAAQQLVLKYLEDTPEHTVFILCSTAPHKVIETLQGRCMVYTLRELEMTDTLKLVEKLLRQVECDRPADRLVDALVENGIKYPRQIAHAVEKYVGGAKADEAAQVQGSTAVEVKALTRSMVKGDWDGVRKYLSDAQRSDVRPIRLSCIAYMRRMLLESSEIGERTKAVTIAIDTLAGLENAEDIVLAAGLASTLYNVTAVFARYKH